MKKTIDETEAQDRLNNGWIEIRSAGYCVSSQSCGANRKLGQLTANDGSDIYYSTDYSELDAFNTMDPYTGTLVAPICWLF